jgi:hypothetical protein
VKGLKLVALETAGCRVLFSARGLGGSWVIWGVRFGDREGGL